MKMKLSPELQRQAAALAAMPETEIDTQDIPEAPAEAWQHARRPDFYRPMKKMVTLRLDLDVVSWFKDHTENG